MRVGVITIVFILYPKVFCVGQISDVTALFFSPASVREVGCFQNLAENKKMLLSNTEQLKHFSIDSTNQIIYVSEVLSPIYSPSRTILILRFDHSTIEALSIQENHSTGIKGVSSFKKRSLPDTLVRYFSTIPNRIDRGGRCEEGPEIPRKGKGRRSYATRTSMSILLIISINNESHFSLCGIRYSLEPIPRESNMGKEVWDLINAIRNEF